jgi:hypothetical protein
MAEGRIAVVNRNHELSVTEGRSERSSGRRLAEATCRPRRESAQQLRADITWQVDGDRPSGPSTRSIRRARGRLIDARLS